MIYLNFTKRESLVVDVCIIGGGPVAIALALELADTGITVALLAGGSESSETEADQSLHLGVIARPGSHENLAENRRRQFGGASSAWGGRCIPFDPIDFEARPWMTESKWPVTYKEMEPYFAEATAMCRAGKGSYDARVVFPGQPTEIIPGMDNEEVQSWQLERWSPPIDFSVEYRQFLERSTNVSVYLNTHLIALDCEVTKEQVSVARVRSRHHIGTIRAGTFVLATGGIENARLLLASRGEHHPNGLGNERDLVGRYYQCHLHGTYATLSPKPSYARSFEYQQDEDGVYCRRRWTLTADTQRKLQIGNIIFFLDRVDQEQGHRDAMFSAVFLIKSMLRVVKAKGWQEKRAYLADRGVREHFQVFLRDGLRIIPSLWRIGLARFSGSRRLPSILPDRTSKQWGLYYQAEQTPNYESRITLSPDQVDAHGTPRAVVDLRFVESDVRTVVEAHRVLMDRYEKAEAGTALYDEASLKAHLEQQKSKFNSSAHHLGTTRMSASPEEGVVDGDCKVHGIDNLYVSGSSIFTTGGNANPTLTAVAFAIRLGDHLKRIYLGKEL